MNRRLPWEWLLADIRDFSRIYSSAAFVTPRKRIRLDDLGRSAYFGTGVLLIFGERES